MARQTNGDKYYRLLKKSGLVGMARGWLKNNPPPKGWKGGRWAWAYTEMSVIKGNFKGLMR